MYGKIFASLGGQLDDIRRCAEACAMPGRIAKSLVANLALATRPPSALRGRSQAHDEQSS